MFAKFQNNKIVELNRQPKSKRVSSIHLNPAALKSEDWYPYEEVRPEKTDKEKYGEPTVELVEDKVVKTFPVVEKGLEEYREQRKSDLMLNYQGKAHGVVDPFLQQYDPRTAANTPELKSIVDIYKAKVEEIDSATTLAELEAVDIT